MEDLPKTPFLLRRNGRCYYRRRVPDELIDALGKREVKVSLGTSNLREAKQRIALENLKTEELFAEARRAVTPAAQLTTTPPPAGLSKTELERISLLWFKEAEAKANEHFFSTQATITPEERVSKVDELIDDLSALESGHETIYSSAVQPVSKKLLHQKGIELDPENESYQQLCSFIQRGLIQLAHNGLARYQFSGGSHRKVPDALFSPSNVASLTPARKEDDRSTNWKKTIASFIEAQKSDGKTDKTIDGYRLAFQFSTEFFGPDKRIASITPSDCRQLRDKLVKLPSNAKKRYPTLSLIQATEILSESDTSRLSTTTVNTQMRKLSTIFNFAVREGLIDKNPASHVKKLKPKKREQQGREPFNTSELNIIFNQPLYTGCVDDQRGFNKPGPNKPKGARFWVPLLSLFSGMRLDEYCHLFTDDIDEIDGVPVIHVRVDNDEEKSLKTEHSERIVPIHPVLQELGFLEFADQAKCNLQKLLFSDLPKSASGSYSANFSKWHTRYLNLCGIKRKGLCFHSFRHTFRDAARECRLEREAIAAIGGWKDSEDVMDAYGKGHSVTRLYEELRKIDYQQFDLKHLI